MRRGHLPLNPNHGKFVKPEGYTDIGWQMSLERNPEYKACYEKGHFDRTKPIHTREYDNSMYMNRGTDVITICDECKIIWHTDMSD